MRHLVSLLLSALTGWLFVACEDSGYPPAPEVELCDVRDEPCALELARATAWALGAALPNGCSVVTRPMAVLPAPRPWTETLPIVRDLLAPEDDDLPTEEDDLVDSGLGRGSVPEPEGTVIDLPAVNQLLFLYPDDGAPDDPGRARRRLTGLILGVADLLRQWEDPLNRLDQRSPNPQLYQVQDGLRIALAHQVLFGLEQQPCPRDPTRTCTAEEAAAELESLVVPALSDPTWTPGRHGNLDAVRLLSLALALRKMPAGPRWPELASLFEGDRFCVRHLLHPAAPPCALLELPLPDHERFRSRGGWARTSLFLATGLLQSVDEATALELAAGLAGSAGRTAYALEEEGQERCWLKQELLRWDSPELAIRFMELLATLIGQEVGPVTRNPAATRIAGQGEWTVLAQRQEAEVALLQGCAGLELEPFLASVGVTR